jgi:hypothetical protein
MDSRVKIDIPSSVSLETDEGINMFTRQNMIALCRKLLKNFRDWDFIIEGELGKGKHLELAWRMNTKLDWVWLDDDVDGKRREWAVLCGLPLKQVEFLVLVINPMDINVTPLVWDIGTSGDTSGGPPTLDRPSERWRQAT